MGGWISCGFGLAFGEEGFSTSSGTPSSELLTGSARSFKGHAVAFGARDVEDADAETGENACQRGRLDAQTLDKSSRRPAAPSTSISTPALRTQPASRCSVAIPSRTWTVRRSRRADLQAIEPDALRVRRREIRIDDGVDPRTFGRRAAEVGRANPDGVGGRLELGTRDEAVDGIAPAPFGEHIWFDETDAVEPLITGESLASSGHPFAERTTRTACAIPCAGERNGTCNRTFAMKTTTMGQLIAKLFSHYERELHDEELAAVATQVALAELMGRSHARTEAPLRKAA